MEFGGSARKRSSANRANARCSGKRETLPGSGSPGRRFGVGKDAPVGRPPTTITWRRCQTGGVPDRSEQPTLAGVFGFGHRRIDLLARIRGGLHRRVRAPTTRVTPRWSRLLSALVQQGVSIAGHVEHAARNNSVRPFRGGTSLREIAFAAIFTTVRIEGRTTGTAVTAGARTDDRRAGDCGGHRAGATLDNFEQAVRAPTATMHPSRYLTR